MAMTRDEARQIALDIWGTALVASDVTLPTLQRIDAEALPGETAIATIARIGELPGLADIRAFDTAAVRELVLDAEES